MNKTNKPVDTVDRTELRCKRERILRRINQTNLIRDELLARCKPAFDKEFTELFASLSAPDQAFALRWAKYAQGSTADRDYRAIRLKAVETFSSFGVCCLISYCDGLLKRDKEQLDACDSQLAKPSSEG